MAHDGSGNRVRRFERPTFTLATCKHTDLAAIGIATILLEGWMIIEAVLLLPRIRGVLEDTAGELDQLKMPARM